MNASQPKLVVIEKKADDPKPKSRSGAERMREAADKIIGKDCRKIAQALSESSKKGQILSAKFLYDLAEKKEKAGEGEGAHKFRSMASELASAPPWTGDWPKDEKVEDDETDS